MIDPTIYTEARTLLAQLEMVSHGRAQNPDPSRGGDGSGFPPGGVVRKDDLEPDHPQKSHEHFRRRLRRCQTTEDVAGVAKGIEAALDAWKRTAAPPQDSQAWRRVVGTQGGSVRAVADEWNLSPSRVHQLRQQYREAA